MKKILLSFCAAFSVPGVAAETFDLSKLRRLVDETQPQNVEQFLAELGRRAPSMRRNYLLVFESRSLQDATYERPRVISYTPDAQLIVAYQGWNDGKKTGQSIEIVAFEESTEEFAFYNLDLSTKDPDRPVHLSEKNPALCLTCHRGPDPRPNWEQYPRWPGVYKSRAHPHPIDEELGLPAGREAEGYRRFLSRQADRGRYSFLANPADRYRPKDEQSDGYDEDEGKDLYKYKPNTEFSQKIGWLNIRRLARRIDDLEAEDGERALDELGHSVMGALNEEELTGRYAPKDGIERPAFSDLLAEVKSERSQSPNEFTSSFYHREVAGLLYLLNPYDPDPKDWSTALLEPASRYPFVMPAGSLAIYLSARLAELNPELAPHARYEINRHGESFVTFEKKND